MAKNKTIDMVKSQVIYKDYSKDAERTALMSGENLAHAFGKIARWYTDISWVGHTHTVANITDFPILGTAAAKNVSASGGDAGNDEVVLGNDSRLSDSRTPTAHTHSVSDINDFPTLGTAAGYDVPASGDAGDDEVVLGNDSRLSDARTPTAHTHTEADITNLGTYAGASTKGGAATSANKLNIGNSDIGNSITPVYFDSETGLPIALSYTIEKSVPADAVFTDTTYSTMGPSGSSHAGGLVPDTPSTAGTSKYLREDGTWAVPPNSEYVHPSYTPYSSGLYKITVDTLGHVSAASAVSGTDLPSHSHTVSDITNFPTLGTAAGYDVPATGDADDDEVVLGNDSRLSDARTPLSHTHTEADISDLGTYAGSSTKGGAATSANKLNIGSADIGSETKPVYFSYLTGKPVACAYTIRTSVPANAVFTDVNVKQSPSTANESREVLFAGNTGNTETVGTVGKNNQLYFNPNTGALTAKSFSGSINASNLTGTIDAGRLPTTSVTAGSYGPAAGGTLVHGGTFDAAYVTVDKYGRLTAASTKTFTLPAQYVHPTHTAKTSGLYKITVDNLGHVSGATAATASDLPSHTHPYIPLSGSTAITGELRVTMGETAMPTIDVSNGNYRIGIHVGSGGVNHGVYDFTTGINTWMCYHNGTEFLFNGKANTAGKWATARKLTIGSSGKSVDGSGNVSWTLSEIGAAPTSHTHQYAKSSSINGPAYSVEGALGSTTVYRHVWFSVDSDDNRRAYNDNFKFEPSRGIIKFNGWLPIDLTGQTANLNDYNDSGENIYGYRRYICKTTGGGSNISNKAVDAPFVLEVILIRWASTTDYITKQIYHGFDKKTYQRFCTNGTWSAWTEQKYTDTVYTHPTTSGNKHIPSGGSSGQYLKWSSDGTATWSAIAATDLPSHTHSQYLPLTGGTMTGAITFQVADAIKYNASSTTTNMISFITGASDGHGVRIGGGGLIVIGSGESSTALVSALSLTGNTEQTYIASDNNITFYSKCQTIGERLGIVYDNSGRLRPDTDNTRTLGGSDFYWNKAYITQVIGRGTGGSWILSRDNAIVRQSSMSTNSAYFPVISAKTKIGEWSVGTLGPSSEHFYFSYTLDTNYSAGTNTSKTYYISTDGWFNGTAAKADKWTTARTLTLTGSVTGSASIDGSGNVSLATTTNHTHNYAGSPSAGGPATKIDIQRVTEDANTLPGKNISIFKEYSSSSTNIPSTHFYHIITMEGPDTAYATQLALGMTTTKLCYRVYSSSSWGSWKTVSFSDHTHSYLPLSGGTMTGDINFTAVTSTEYPAKSKQIYFSGSTDWAKIYYQVDASDAGRLVFDIGDDTNTRIVFANSGTAKSYIDASGNFSGNAATATRSTNSDNCKVTVTDPSSETSYGVVFVANPNTTEDNMLRKSNDIRFVHFRGAANTEGVSALVLGNSTAKTAANNSTGRLTLYGSAGGCSRLFPNTNTGTIDIVLPSTAGTMTDIVYKASNYYATSGHTHSQYLPLAGGTMTGILNLWGNRYDDNYALNCNNSTIIGANAIKFNDLSDSAGEGIMFYRSTTTWDSVWAKNGVLYFTPNHPTDTTNNVVYHSGNLSISRSLTSGTKIATITLNGTATDLYCEKNTNTDTMVTQSETTTSSYRNIMAGYNSAADASTSRTGAVTNVIYSSNSIFMQPSSGSLYAKVLNAYNANADASMILNRGGSSTCWRFLNTGGTLKIQCDWTTEKVSYFDVLTLGNNKGTMTSNVYLKLGSSNTTTLPTCGLFVHDIRDVAVPASGLGNGQIVNFYFHNTGTPNSEWWSIMHVKGWYGAYCSWELAGTAHNGDGTSRPLYVRTTNSNTAWGSWRKIYDTSNKPTPSEIGAAASSHTHSYIPLAGSKDVTGEIVTSSANGYRLVYSKYGAIIRNDGSYWWFLITAKQETDAAAKTASWADTSGLVNNAHPLRIALSDGRVTINGYTINKSVPSTAVFTDTTYTIATGDSNGQIKVTPSSGSAYNVSVKGLGSAAYTASTAYAAASHTHSYLPLSGGTMTGAITFQVADAIKYNASSATLSMISFMTGTADGHGIRIGGGGAVVIGSGESSTNLVSNLSITGQTETTYVSSDNNIEFYSGCQTIANKKRVTIDSNGHIIIGNGQRILQNQNDTSNYSCAIRWCKNSTDPGNYGPEIGQHNTGDTDGSICILPYHTTTSPWGGNVGLFISKTNLKYNGTSVSLSGHTHSYAGSSSAGGAATSANKLNTDAGSSTKGVYFSSGVPVACSYSLSRNVLQDYSVTSSNTNNYPYHLLCYMKDTAKGYKDFYCIFRVTAGYDGQVSGVYQATVRMNNGSASSVNLRLISGEPYRGSLSNVVAGYNTSGTNTYMYIFLVCATYARTTVRIIHNGGFTFYSSNEVADTTTSDKKTSVQVYATMAAAGSALVGGNFAATKDKLTVNNYARTIVPTSYNEFDPTSSSTNKHPVLFAAGTSSLLDTYNVGIEMISGITYDTIQNEFYASTSSTSYLKFTQSSTSYSLKIYPTTLTANRTITLPDAGGTVTNVIFKTTKTASSATHTGWTNATTDDKIVPTMTFMAYWNGAYNASNNSNLTYCNRGAFGTIVTKGTGDYVANTNTGLSQAINKLTTGDADPQDNDYYVCQYAGGGTATTSYHRRKHSSLWSYINGKAYSLYASKSVTLYTGSTTITSGLQKTAVTVSQHFTNYDFVIIYVKYNSSPWVYGTIMVQGYNDTWMNDTVSCDPGGANSGSASAYTSTDLVGVYYTSSNKQVTFNIRNSMIVYAIKGYKL